MDARLRVPHYQSALGVSTEAGAACPAPRPRHRRSSRDAPGRISPFPVAGGSSGEVPTRSILVSVPALPRQSLALLPTCSGQGQADLPGSTRRHCSTGRAKSAALPRRHAAVVSSKGSAALSIIKGNFPRQSREITQPFVLLICC